MRGKAGIREIPSLEQIQAERDRLRYGRRYRALLRSTLGTLAVVAALSVLGAMLWFPFLRIYGTSMTPTLQDGEVFCCVKTSDFRRGDVAAFYYNNKILVKRVIGLSGDWVCIDENGNVSVNDSVLEEPYLTGKALGNCDVTFPYQVPEDRLFVLGDHRDTSVDSRHTLVGCVAQEQIVGKLWIRIWPLDRIKVFG